MNTVKKTGGFTLVELIIVIAILAILSSVAVAGYSSYITKANDSAASTFLNNMASHIVLANAAGGGIQKIEVAQTAAEANLTVTVTFDSGMGKDFKSDFQKGFGIAPNNDYSESAKTITITVPAAKLPTAWGNSSYEAKTTIWTNGGLLEPGATLPTEAQTPAG